MAGGSKLKEIIKEKLDSMGNLAQRKILKNVMEGVFESLLDYQEEMSKNLEARVFNQIENQESNYNIYTTIVKQDKLNLIDDFLFPILDRDKEEIDKGEIIKQINQKEELIITRVFFDLGYQEIENLRKENRIFSGIIVGEEREYKISFELRYNQEYLKAEKELYEIFIENSLAWRTINNPYIRKIFDVVIVDYDEKVEELSDFESIDFDLEEFDDNKYLNYIPVWNIGKIYKKADGFPMAARDKVNYDHMIYLDNMNVQNGYLVVVNDYNIVSIRKSREELVITSDESNSVPWEILKVVQERKFKNYHLEFELMSNTKKDSFMDKTFQQNHKVIKTLGEINRICNSFQNINEFNLEEVKILENMTYDSFTYDYNQFIEDEIRIANLKKVMLLKFSSNREDYLKYDLLSFIVSELQMYFPDYICEGVCE